AFVVNANACEIVRYCFFFSQCAIFVWNSDNCHKTFFPLMEANEQQCLRQCVFSLQPPTRTPVFQDDALPARGSRPRCKARVGATETRDRLGFAPALPRRLRPVWPCLDRSL